MQAQDIIELKELLAECFVPGLEVYFYDTVYQKLRQIEAILDRFELYYPHYCLRCYNTYVAKHLSSPCPYCGGTEVLDCADAEIQEERDP